MEKLIAYRDVDSEQDVWNERCFLFEAYEGVDIFFVADNPLLLEIYTDDEENELRDFEISRSPSGHISHISFETNYSGKVNISPMNEGYFIPTKVLN